MYPYHYHIFFLRASYIFGDAHLICLKEVGQKWIDIRVY